MSALEILSHLQKKKKQNPVNLVNKELQIAQTLF